MLIFKTRFTEMFQRIANIENTLLIFQTGGENSKHVTNHAIVSNALLIFKTRFKCFKRVANIQNTFQIFQTRC